MRSPAPFGLQDSAFQKGISFTAWWAGQYSAPAADLALGLLYETGATWISLVVTGHQADYASTTIDRTDPSTPTDADLIHAIQQAHSLGLKVMLKPHVDLWDESEGRWRGDIGSTFASEQDWAAWFASYRTFIEHYARLAQEHGVEQFCVGTELLGTTHRAADWRAIIAGLRSIYAGPLVYAALHGGEETSITWWDALDYIGVDAYYPLYEDAQRHPSIEELEDAWEAPKAVLANLSDRYGKPILLTEIGYRSHHGCTGHPWDSVAVSPIDLEEQAYAYEAAFRQLHDQEWLAGMFWWQWLADPFSSGPHDDGYSPHLKPAEDVLRAWYGGKPRTPERILIPDEKSTMAIYLDGLAEGWQDWSWGAAFSAGAPGQARSGSSALGVTLEPWAAVSFWHPAFSTATYHWLEFYIRSSTAEEPRLVVYFECSQGIRMCQVPVSDCRHLIESHLPPDPWRRVRIPLSYLNAPGVPVSRIFIQDASGQGTALFWIDDLRLVGAQEPTGIAYLPVISMSR